MEGFESVIDAAQQRSRDSGRRFAGPILFVPFDVLIVALDRDVDVDAADPRAAIRSVAGEIDQDAAGRYGVFLSHIEGSRPDRRRNLALAAFYDAGDLPGLRTALETFPELLDLEVRAEVDETVQRARASGDPIGERVASAHAELLAGCARGDVEAAWEHCSEAMSAAFQDVIGNGIGDLRSAFDEAYGDDKAAAAEIGDVLISRTRELGMTPLEADACALAAGAWFERSDGDRAANVERAYELLDRALALVERNPDSVDNDERIRFLLNQGAVVAARHQGDPVANQDRAIALQREVLTLTTKETNGPVWAMAHTNLGLSLMEREHVLQGSGAARDEIAARVENALSEAIAHFERALTWRTIDNDPLGWSYTQVNLALAHARWPGADRPGHLRQAVQHAGDAARGFESERAFEQQAVALGNRASAGTDLASFEEVDAHERQQLLAEAEEDARTAIQLRGEGATGIDAGRGWSQLARNIAAQHGCCPELVKIFRRVKRELRPEIAPRDCRDLGRRLGDIASVAGEWEFAAEAWEYAALGAASAIEARATQGGRFAEMKEGMNVFRWAAYAQVRVGALERAVEVIELGRGHELASWLHRDVVDLDALREADSELCSRFIDHRNRVDAVGRTAAAAPDTAAAQSFEMLAATIVEIRALPGFEHFLKRERFEDLASGLDSNEAIAYPITAPQGASWLLVTRGDDGAAHATAIDLPSLTSMSALEALLEIDPARRVVLGGYLPEQSVGGAALDEAIARLNQRLGPSLMQPLAAKLAEGGYRSVCLAPIGLLGRVPLHVLEWDEGGSPRCLLDDFEVAYTASAHVRNICARRADGRSGFERLVAIGNPLPNSDPLGFAEDEAATVHATVPASEKLLLQRHDATKEAVLDALPLATHIHLACHGEAAADDAAFSSALYFDNDRPASAEEILDLDLSRARLVVVSACETGIVPGYEIADEVLSLSTVFIGAGAAGVIASLWAVDDYGTSLLMTRFYEGLVATPNEPARALRAAQLWLRDLSQDEEASYTARHPALVAARAKRVGTPRGGSGHRATDEKGSAGFDAPTMWAGFVFSGA